jgi:DNA-binding response OmpR family regulator
VGHNRIFQELHKLDVPVLTLTNAQSLEGRTRALEAGANEVLNMASSVEKIVGAVNRLLSD